MPWDLRFILVGCVSPLKRVISNLAQNFAEAVQNNKDNTDRQWLYQTCTEFGWCQSSDSYKQPFGDWFSFPWNYTGDQCRDIFGMQYYSYLYDNTEETNRYYGGLKLPASNIALPSGSIDPWHATSITNTTGTQADVIYIEGTAHGADMLPSSDQDPPQLRAAREKIAQIIGKWLS